jgi:2-iminobutanoate/2-iminopropanoate deaminase
MENMRAVLTAANSSFPQVVKTTILLADMADFPKVNEAYAAYFPGNPPARATFAVKGLPKGGLVEIEAVAVHN